MGKGGSSKSTSNTTNVSGQNGIQGDNLGASIAGVNNSTVSVNMTDHGAIEKAGQLAELAMTTAGNSTQAALDSNTKVSTSAMDHVSDFAGDTLKQQAQTNSENLQYMAGLAGNQANQNAKNLETIKELASLNVDGGQLETSSKMSSLTVVIVLVIGIIAAMAVGGKS